MERGERKNNNTDILVALDLESVLIPEIWPFLANELGLKDLLLTTRDIKDFNLLTSKRFRALNSHNISLDQLLTILRKLRPLPGAVQLIEFLNSRNISYVVISDSFEEFLPHIREDLHIKKLVANSLKEENGILVPYIKVGGKKGKVLKECFELGGKTIIGVGDSFNDLELLEYSHIKVLINPPKELAQRFPQAYILESAEGLIGIIEMLGRK